MTPAQLRTLLGGATRELVWGLRAVRREHHAWLRRAAAIPDPELRRDATAALHDKRPLLDGAALFWILVDRRRPDLLRLLVDFQMLANYHDHAGERAGAHAAVERGRACVERVDPGHTMEHFAAAIDLRRTPHHYWPSPAHRDGGYLTALVAACRDGCRHLPHYDAAHHHLVAAVHGARTLDLEHVAERDRRPLLLQTFVGDAFGAHGSLTWFELAAGASSLLTAIAVLALAASPDTTPADLAAAVEAYTLAAALSALLDNYVDYEDDLAAGSHNYLTYYGSLDAAVMGVADLIQATLEHVGRLRHADRHRVIVASMVAMYLTSDGARAKDPRLTDALVARGGRLTRALMPVLAAWRTARSERGA